MKRRDVAKEGPVEHDNEHVNEPADSRGAVDLAASARSVSDDAASRTEADGGQARITIDLPLITEATEATFQDVMATSQTVPVVIVMWSGRSLESKPAIDTLEEVARDLRGAFQLVKIDIEQAPQVAQAFQIQAVPTTVALVGGRPVPLFQGNAVKDQVRSIIDQLLQAAQQMGVTGVIRVDEQDTLAPIPPEHLDALSAEDEGRLEDAVTAWEKVIELNPRDEDAKAHLSRVRLRVRSEHADLSDPAAQADQLFGAGEVERAFDILLNVMATADDAQAKESARVRLLDLLRVAGNTPEVKKARMRLASLLMI
ncbi:tetratricopeptide repeat protein [Schaalia sp. ZJ405]|uniref:tetratricopeptide repeat protein n=1 Tax=unclassified Schaalia TaxID=2691889 RepID=UPI0013ED9455|nr:MULTISPECIES: tetratricopeptide repeat protein [unclassified Schaalia]QPK80608.1 tetratricopeptide repeat protein [Schaalia sp. ZJ405]